MRGATKTAREKFIRKLWKKFLTYTKNRKLKYVDIQEMVLNYVQSLNVQMSTKRTYLHHILGCMGRRQQWWDIDRAGILRKDLMLRDFYRKVTAVAPLQSDPARIADLQRLAEPARSHLTCCLLLCGRLGDYSRNIDRVVVNAEKVTIEWLQHKTVGLIGPKKVSVPLPKTLGFRLKLMPLGPTPLETLKATLQSVGLKAHSLRRGGVAYYRSLGLRDSVIMKITLHTSWTYYFRYISTINTEERIP